MASSFEGFLKSSKNRIGANMETKKSVKLVSSYNQSSANSFSDTYNYSDADGYTATLSKAGSSYVYSGSYTPGDSKSVTTTLTGTAYVYRAGYSTNDPPKTTSYSSDGYSGTLSLVSNLWGDGTYYPADSPIYVSYPWTATYSGTVTKPASDTRIYRQNYIGYALKLANKIYRKVNLC